MNILILNWRDIKSPAGGGAEILTHEMAKRWVIAGHNVTQFSASFPKAKHAEIIDGVHLIRRGKWWSVHVHGFFFYLKNKTSFDVIIDEVHWFPFFAALYAPTKTITFTCEIANRLLFKIFPYPIAFIFSLLERLYLFIYRNIPTMVISKSTYDELIRTGHRKDNVVILPMGVTVPKNIPLQIKEKIPTIVSVGRLNVQKGTLDVLDAFKVIHSIIPKSKLWLVGSGSNEFTQKVKNKIVEYNLQKSVVLYGFVSEQDKFHLLSKATVLISASSQEGWGLTIPEAGIMKTPSVVYNIEGFRDIIDQNKNGILVDKNPQSLANATVHLLQNPSRMHRMQDAIYKKSQLYSWEKTAEVSINFIQKYTNS